MRTRKGLLFKNMSCYSPLKALKISNLKTGEFIKMEFINFIPEKKYEIRAEKNILKSFEYLEIPCGSCAGCKLEYAKNWATRIMLEAKEYEFNNVLTLTYDDEHLTKNEGIDTNTGEIKSFPTLVKSDVQKFFKRLRKTWHEKYNEDKIRFYMCGEYGKKNGRPHYHIICFNLKIHDKEFFKYNTNGFKLYESKEIEKIWGLGDVKVNDLSYEMACYIARYVLKKQLQNNGKEKYIDRHQIPEYTAMSRKPGIARKYYDEHKGVIYETQEIWLQTKKKVEKIKPSRYFDSLYEQDEEEKFRKLKAKRKKDATERLYTILQNTDLSSENYKLAQENIQKLKLNKLIRKYEEE